MTIKKLTSKNDIYVELHSSFYIVKDKNTILLQGTTRINRILWSLNLMVRLHYLEKEQVLTFGM